MSKNLAGRMLPCWRYWQDFSLENADHLRFLITPAATKWQYTNGVEESRIKRFQNASHS